MSFELVSHVCVDRNLCVSEKSARETEREMLRAKIQIFAGKASALASTILGSYPSTREPAVVHHHHSPSWPWFWGSSCRDSYRSEQSCSSKKRSKEKNDGVVGAIIVGAIAVGVIVQLTKALGSSFSKLTDSNAALTDAAEFKSAADSFEKLADTPQDRAFAIAAREAAMSNERLAGRTKASSSVDCAINPLLILNTIPALPWASCILGVFLEGTRFQQLGILSCEADNLLAPFANTFLATGIGLCGLKLLKKGYDSVTTNRDALALRNSLVLLQSHSLPR